MPIQTTKKTHLHRQQRTPTQTTTRGGMVCRWQGTAAAAADDDSWGQKIKRFGGGGSSRREWTWTYREASDAAPVAANISRCAAAAIP